MIGIAPLAARRSLFLIAWPCSSALVRLAHKLSYSCLLTLHVDPLLFPKEPRDVLDFLRKSPLDILGGRSFHTTGPRGGLDGRYESRTSAKVLLQSMDARLDIDGQTDPCDILSLPFYFALLSRPVGETRQDVLCVQLIERADCIDQRLRLSDGSQTVSLLWFTLPSISSTSSLMSTLVRQLESHCPGRHFDQPFGR